MTIFQLLVAMISTLQIMQDTILILTSLFVSGTAVHIVTILPGLEHEIFLQMSWRFITKSLLETGRQHSKRKAKKTTTTKTTATRKTSTSQQKKVTAKNEEINKSPLRL